MLSEPLKLGKVDATRLFDFLYSFFHRDFIAEKAYLNGSVWIDPRSHRLDDGKELDFWHLTTREQSRQVKQGNQYLILKERLPDYRRSERIEWVKKIITNHTHPAVRLFYHQETNDKRNIRLYLWVYQHDFVVILQRLGKSSSFLVTSFYIDHAGKKRDYQYRYERYLSGKAMELQGCEWF
jgi:hypothetical protein